MNFKKHFSYFLNDYKGEISYIIREQENKIVSSISTIHNHLNCFFKGIEVDKSVRFTGRTYFFRFPTSKIIVGKKCKFNSTKTINLIGTNRKCILSTNLPEAVLKIGDNCGFSGTVIGCYKSIELGKNIKCGANTLITDSDWHLEDYRSGELKGVKIGDNVWLGVNSVVLKGVEIGENSVIGANSVVTKSIPPNVVAAGNPCKILRSLET